jgi:hypothetical protein
VGEKLGLGSFDACAAGVGEGAGGVGEAAERACAIEAPALEAFLSRLVGFAQEEVLWRLVFGRGVIVEWELKITGYSDFFAWLNVAVGFYAEGEAAV